MTITGIAGGVPFTALPPSGVDGPAPMVAAWHLLDSPRTDAAMAGALSMNDLPAWRVYFGLPMTGRRELPGGWDALMELGMQDAVLNLYEPMTEQAASEFPAALADLRSQLSISDGPVGIAGGSAGGLVAYEVTARAEVPIAATAFINPVTQLGPVIEANSRRFEVDYQWTEASRAVCDRYDFVRRADEIKVPALLVIGEDDDICFREPAAVLAKRPEFELVTVPGMQHAVAEEPGLEAAPQTAHAKLVDAEWTRWFAKYLVG